MVRWVPPALGGGGRSRFCERYRGRNDMRYKSANGAAESSRIRRDEDEDLFCLSDRCLGRRRQQVAATSPGLIMRCKLLGVLQTLQQTKRKRIRNDRVIAVPENSHRERELHGLEGISPEVRAEMEKFFVATDELEAKTLKFLGWKGPAEAKKLIRRCEKAFKKEKA